MSKQSRQEKWQETLALRARRWLETTSPIPYSLTITVPAWHPVYENPLNLEYPLHFDDSATLRPITKEEGRDGYADWLNLETDFITTFPWTCDFCLEIKYTRAKFRSDPPMPVSPPFFVVVVYEGADLASVHERIVELIRKWMKVEDPVVRYFDEDF
ncbi:hypothetical protein CLAFUR4_13449 [Fulvia fulva]|nr:hypothetical protein CLAFUR4_13449 [Fulvia fulva]WPV36232.1 hypothetical protein CLAFUW7_13453 [Fulvia fulva]